MTEMLVIGFPAAYCDECEIDKFLLISRYVIRQAMHARLHNQPAIGNHLVSACRDAIDVAFGICVAKKNIHSVVVGYGVLAVGYP